MAASEQLALGLAPDSPTREGDMDNLPAGWTTRALGDLVTVTGGGTPSKGNPAYWDGSIPWVSPKDMKSFEAFDSQDHITAQAVAESPVKRIAPNSVLVVFRSGILAHTLPIAINRATVTLNQDMKALTPRGEVSCDYLAYYLRSAQRGILEAAKKKGATVESIDADAFLRTPVPFPALPEQHRIVARIEELAAKIVRARGLRREAMQEIEALDASASNLLFDEDARCDWPRISLGAVADIRSGVTLGRKLTGPIIKLPYLRVANVQDGRLDLRVIKEVEVLASEADKWRLQPGDVLLTEGGDWDKLGRGTVWHGEISDCIHQNHIFRVRTNPADFNPRFLAALIASPYGKSYFQSVAKKTTNLASINSTQLKAFEVYKPPIAEQQRIVDYLEGLASKANALKRLQSESAAELDALLPAVLARAFRGEL